MKILFLDQSGKPGGAELCLLDVAKVYRDRSLVCLFADGGFRSLLEAEKIPVQVLATPIEVQKASGVLAGIASLGQLLPLIGRVAQLSRQYDLIYANTQKALVVGALASALSRRPLVYHLHDIVSPEHFSRTNQQIIITLANRFAVKVIANSEASKQAFIAAGGKAGVEVVYNGFEPERYQNLQAEALDLRRSLGCDRQFVIGHFSRLAPWKGQHVLLEALTQCPEEVVALLVGDALFGEQEYVDRLHQQVADLGLAHRVHFLGFRHDVPQLMAACDLVTHTSTAPEPFGRVIVEAMLCGTPVVAAAAGGAIELIEPETTGWLVPPGEPQKLAEVINYCHSEPERAIAIAQKAQALAGICYHLDQINQQIHRVLTQVVGRVPKQSS
jgi:glycosyltransferase involved in cell wall biosynthesis